MINGRLIKSVPITGASPWNKSGTDIFPDTQGDNITNIGDITHDESTADDFNIINNDQDKDIIFKVNDGGSVTEVFRLDGDVSRIGIGTTTSAPGGKVEIKETTATPALKIDQDGEAASILIDSEATTANIITAEGGTLTTGTCLYLNGFDALTTGTIAEFESDSAQTDTRSLVKIINENSAATGTTCLDIKQDSTNRVINISSASTLQTVYITNSANSAASGSVVEIVTTDTGHDQPVLSLTQAGTGANSRGFRVVNAGAGSSILIDSNGNGTALEIDSEATTTNIITCDCAALTTGVGLFMDGADSLTTGTLIRLESNSSDVSTRSLMEIINTNASSSGTIPLYITQDASGSGIYINHNEQGECLTIDQDRPNHSSNQNWDTVSINRNNIASSTSTNNGAVIKLENDVTLSDTATDSSHVIEIVQDSNSTGNSIYIDHNANSSALNIDAETTTGNVITAQGNVLTTGTGLYLNGFDALTTGTIAEFESDSAQTNTRSLVKIINENSASTGTTCLEIRNDSTGPALDVDGYTKWEPSSTQSLQAADALSPTKGIMEVAGNGGAVTLTSTPSITAGADGQILIIQGTHDTNTVTFQDESNLASSNLQLSGGNNFTLGAGDILTLIYNSNLGYWAEVSRSDN